MSNEALYVAAVGEAKTDYYVPRFQAFDAKGKAGISWHWPAFLVTLPWLLWRQMWGMAGLYFVLPTIVLMLVGALAALLGPAGPFVSGLLYLATILAMWVVPGLYGNAWYYGHCNDQIKAVTRRQKPLELQIAELEKKGGTSWIGLGLYLGLCVLGTVLIGILAAIAIPAYQDYTFKAKVAEAHQGIQENILLDQSASYAASQRWTLIDDEQLTVTRDNGDEVTVLTASNNTETGEITVELAYPDEKLRGKTILYTPYTDDDGSIIWGCSSDTLPEQLLPSQCRDLE